MRRAGRELIEVDRNRQFLADALSEATSQHDAVVHADAGNRNEGNDIDRADARMRAAMARHVDQLRPFVHELECSLQHSVRIPDKRDHGAIGVRSGIDIEQSDAGDSRCRRHRLDHVSPSPLRNIWHALDELHPTHSSPLSRTESQLPR